MAEKLITLAKRNNEPCRRSAQAMLYVRFSSPCPNPRLGVLLLTGLFRVGFIDT